MECFKKLVFGFVLPCMLITANASVARTVCLVDNGRAKAVLILADDAQEDEKLASVELREYFGKMSGAKLQLAHGKAPEGLIEIRIGLYLAPELESIIHQQSRDPSAFVIKVEPKKIILAGLSPEGTLFAAYEFLEQLGCRWFLPGELGTVVPRQKTITVVEGQTVRSPSFSGRHLQNVSSILPWYRRQKLGGACFPSAHGIGLLPQADIKKNPELFALVNGQRTGEQLCVSNPEVLKRAIAYTLDYFQKNPKEPWFGMGPADGSGFCECEHCRKLDAGEWDPFSSEPSVTDRYIWFFNRVIDAVHKKYPGKKIGFYSYHTYQFPPRKVKPSPFICPALAPISLCRIHGMSNPICPDRSLYRDLMADWCKLLPEVYERGYYFNLACPGFPYSKIHAIRDETPVAYQLGIKGWRVECAPAWAAQGPMLYVAARLMWDAHTDIDALLADFYEKFYGSAAGPMGEYWYSLDHAYRNTDCHTGSSFCIPHILNKSWMVRANALLDDAESKAKEPPYAERVRIVRLSYEHLAAFEQMLDARNRFDFAAAHQSLDRLKAITQKMVDYNLNPAVITQRQVQNELGDRGGISLYQKSARLLHPSAGVSYLERFWSTCTESGYERTVVRGQLVAGVPEVWDFLIDSTNVGELLHWYGDGRIGGNWQKIHTSSASWGDQGLHYYKGSAWYRGTVAAPETFKGRKIFLWFGGVDEQAKVWMNGTLLGESAELGRNLPGAGSSFSPFEVEVTKVIRFDRPNFIAVKITNRVVDELGTGGITAPVMLWSPKAH
jgi:hypothetical protein